MQGNEVPPDDFLRLLARIPENVIYRSFGSETVLLNLDTSNYHGVNPTGGRLLELLEDNDGRMSDAVEGMCAEYDRSVDEIVPDLLEFCRALAARGLLEIDAPGGG